MIAAMHDKYPISPRRRYGNWLITSEQPFDFSCKCRLGTNRAIKPDRSLSFRPIKPSPITTSEFVNTIFQRLPFPVEIKRQESVLEFPQRS